MTGALFVSLNTLLKQPIKIIYNAHFQQEWRVD